MTKDNRDLAVFTACNVAYIDKALALAESLYEHDGVRLKICLFDRKRPLALAGSKAEVIWVEDLGLSTIYNLAFKYDVTEFSTSLKPYITLKLLENYERVIYLDPDILTYGSLAPILRDLDSHPIVLTPHYMTPHADSLPDGDVAMLRFGSFNLGFYAVKRDEQALAFLRWWSDRCIRFCYFEAQFGFSTDQKWVSIAPCFFKDLYISFDPGYNAAFWNSHERSFTRGADGRWIVNGKHPLVFFHFSSFDEDEPDFLSRKAFHGRAAKRADLAGLARGYDKALKRWKLPGLSSRYAFDYMSGGEYISPTLRRAYACVEAELPPGHDPFDSSGPVGRFARKNHLLGKKSARYVRGGFGDLPAHKGKLAVVNAVMRIILRLLGPNQFTNFSRLLVYLSSYRQNRGMWKL